MSKPLTAVAPLEPLKLMVYDRTCIRKGGGLSTAWFAGSLLYRGLGRIDACFGARSWDEALEWLASYDRESSRPIDEIQYWGHGRWGRVFIDDDSLDASTLRGARIDAVRERLVPDGKSLVWLRTCEAFGTNAGHEFAQALADRLDARVAGHTFIIGVLQSGLRTLAPGCRPQWRTDEGLAEGTGDKPVRADSSGFRKPRTISCITNEVPDAWFAQDGASS
jgi:hypothetical protein